MEGQTSGDGADPEVGISSIRGALSDQDAAFDCSYDEESPSLEPTVAFICCCVYRCSWCEQ